MRSSIRFRAAAASCPTRRRADETRASKDAQPGSEVHNAGRMNASRDETDEGLMLAYAAGDLDAFALLFDRHERALYRFFLRQTRIPAQADDLLQETFLSVVKSAARYVPSARFTTWLYTIARHKLVDHWRGAGLATSLDDAANDPDDHAEDEGASLGERIAAALSTQPEVRAQSREYARAFLDAVESLPAPQREAFLLQAEGDLSIDEIAAVTAVGTETVKSRLRYALRRLRGACAAWLAPADAPSTRALGVRDEA